MGLAVEVARVEHLGDRPDRAGGEQHRAEDGLLGLEVLRRDRRSATDWATGHGAINLSWKGTMSRSWKPASASVQGPKEHVFQA